MAGGGGSGSGAGPSGGQPSGGTRDRGAARRRLAAEQRQDRERTARRRRQGRIAGAVVGVLVVAGIVTTVTLTRGGTGPGVNHLLAQPLGPEGMAVESGTPLASLTSAATGATVDGISCDATEQAVTHIHTHLALYVDGTLRPLAPGVGAVPPEVQGSGAQAFYGASRCYYWLHVHAQDGVIHIESPTKQTYTLGQLFAIWGQPLSRSQVGPATGTQTVYVDGKLFTGDPASIPLTSRGDIQIDVGQVVPPAPVDWSKSQL